MQLVHTEVITRAYGSHRGQAGRRSRQAPPEDDADPDAPQVVPSRGVQGMLRAGMFGRPSSLRAADMKAL